MGSDPATRFRVPDDRETPQRKVTISRGFYMGTCEVTRGQFAAFVDATGYLTQAEREGWTFAWNGRVWDKVDGASWRKVGFEQTDDHPAICVSFDDAVAFCRWLGTKTGRRVLLPTEAQWEYAARAGTATAFPWGDKWEDGKGWANAADEAVRKRFRGWRTFSWDDGHVFTAPVGTCRANAFGLHDLTGNAWEWTSDWYDKDYYKRGPNVDPLGPAAGSQRVVRGGSWMSSPPRCRSAGRLPCNLRGDYCDAIVGFRIVIDSNPARQLPPCSLPNRPDWPDWRGPRRDGISHHVPTRLPEQVKYLWTQKTAGPGHSGVAAAHGRVLFADKSADGTRDIWRCLDAETGKERWTLTYRAEGDMDYTNSPRATPVVHDGKAYLLGPFGHLHCVDPATGRIFWKRHLIDDFSGTLPAWGVTATPLLVDDKLIVNPGAKDASLVALDRATGKIVWKSQGAAGAYASPILANFNGRRQVIAYDAESLGGWDPLTGKRLWRIVPGREGDYNVPTPIALGERLLVATENNSTRLYGFRGMGYRGTVRVVGKPLRRFDDLAPDMVTPVAHGGMVICPHNAWLYCLDAKTLKLLWKQRDMAFYSYASLIAGNGHVLVLSLDGELLLIRATREKYKLVARLRLFGDKKTQVWSHPALAKGRLYIRNEDSINCLPLR
ncbi:MAG: SUMF1/EgtB/PvdO family nonheme iron enzyme [Candidatus Brocadiae bacterium]|nr:SUMF1/EgtB/PvdO family nonheme iron enzyme [Candidatus Brocadiia bacterium]